mgnify:FL=1
MHGIHYCKNFSRSRKKILTYGFFVAFLYSAKLCSNEVDLQDNTSSLSLPYVFHVQWDWILVHTTLIFIMLVKYKLNDMITLIQLHCSKIWMYAASSCALFFLCSLFWEFKPLFPIRSYILFKPHLCHILATS